MNIERSEIILELGSRGRSEPPGGVGAKPRKFLIFTTNKTRWRPKIKKLKLLRTSKQSNLHSLIHSLIFEITLTDGKVSAKYSNITVHLVHIYSKVATLSQIPGMYHQNLKEKPFQWHQSFK